MPSKFPEVCNICEGFLPVNLATAANNGDYVNVGGYGRIGILFYKGAGTAHEDPTITIQQAVDTSGTSAKALNFTKIWVKQAATNLQGTEGWTVTTQSASNTYTNTSLAEQTCIIWIEINVEDLDTNNSFFFVNASVADVGTQSQIGGLLYFLMDPRDQGANLPIALS